MEADKLRKMHGTVEERLAGARPGIPVPWCKREPEGAPWTGSQESVILVLSVEWIHSSLKTFLFY